MITVRIMATSLCAILAMFGSHVTAVYATEVIGLPRIVDGDTVVVDAIKIRLQGIDAPETDQLCLNHDGERWACGIEARDQLIRRAGDQSWSCNISGVDRFGRSLAVCNVEGEDINRWMVRQGWALAFIRYSHEYVDAERSAREGQFGLWSGAFIAPWDWRHRNKNTVILGALSVPINAQEILLSAVSAAEAPSPECAIKGNINRRGECIYHLPGGHFYGLIKMNRGKRWFCSEDEARAAGCRPSKL